MMYDLIFSIFIISFSLTYLLVPFTIYFANRFGLVDNIKKRPHPAHTHKGIIPRAGGLPIYLGIFIPLLIFFPQAKETIGILIGSSILILVGLWDDKRDRSPYLRFIINIIAAVIVVSYGIDMPYITNPFGGILHFDNAIITLPGIQTTLTLSSIIAIIWIVWTTNIVGWSGGIDGQMPGFVSISAIVIGLLSLRFVTNDPSQLLVTTLSFLTAGAFLGFLPWNFYPQKIMPGYGGKSIAGFMLAVLSMLSYSKLGTALLVLAVPMTDAIFIFIKRLFSGRSPVWASSGHLHHLLLKIGWTKRRIAIFYWLISATTGIIALTLSSKQKVFAAFLILIIITGFLFWINYMRKFPTNKETEDF
jgi:UDP-GlcNAc:undecaprenyl-phosphate/decaprenyl-phosphate GlcNAc-1-phosphate transferase